MKAVIILCTLFGFVMARPAFFNDFLKEVGNVAGSVVKTVENAYAEVLKDERVQRASNFYYRFFTNNGIYQEAKGEGGNIEGSYGWKSPQGAVLQVNYKADEKGYHGGFRLVGIGCSLEASLCGTGMGK